MSRPLLCRVGIHRWYRDSGMFSSVDRCDLCGTPRDKWKARRVAQERRAWNQPGATPGTVAEEMLRDIDP